MTNDCVMVCGTFFNRSFVTRSRPTKEYERLTREVTEAAEKLENRSFTPPPPPFHPEDPPPNRENGDSDEDDNDDDPDDDQENDHGDEDDQSDLDSDDSGTFFSTYSEWDTLTEGGDSDDSNTTLVADDEMSDFSTPGDGSSTVPVQSNALSTVHVNNMTMSEAGGSTTSHYTLSPVYHHQSDFNSSTSSVV